MILNSFWKTSRIAQYSEHYEWAAEWLGAALNDQPLQLLGLLGLGKNVKVLTFSWSIPEEQLSVNSRKGIKKKFKKANYGGIQKVIYYKIDEKTAIIELKDALSLSKFWWRLGLQLEKDQ